MCFICLKREQCQARGALIQPIKAILPRAWHYPLKYLKHTLIKLGTCLLRKAAQQVPYFYFRRFAWFWRRLS